MDAVPYYARYMARNPLRTPAWRWLGAQWLVTQRRYFSRRRDDSVTGQAAHYLRAVARCHGEPSASVTKRYAIILAAHHLFIDDPAAKLLVEARVLARQPAEEIARHTNVPADVVRTYEALFFDCRSALKSRDWISIHAIRSAETAETAAPNRADIAKWFAYHGGPLVLEAVLPYLVGGRDLFTQPLDLATPLGRREQMIQLAVAAQMLPQDVKTEKKLTRIMLMMHEMDLKRPTLPAPRSILAENLDVRLAEALSGAAPERLRKARSTSLRAAWRATTPIAQAQ